MPNHKQLTQQLFERFSVNDIDGAMAMLTEDVTWRLPGKPETFPSAGSYDRARIRRLFDRMVERMEGPLVMTVLDSIAEGDRVAAEVESRATLRNGRKYQQSYHFLLAFRDGKICSVREYLDTQHSYDVWFKE